MPNSLWHNDDHLKLIRWRVIVHGGIDGYSRLPVYLKASTNNRADTVLQCFPDAVRSHDNQRVERLWRDLFMGSISLFYDLFYYLEDAGYMCPSDDADLYALHYVFIHRINAQVDVFRQSYSHHRLSTARNRSPLQLWIQGMTHESGDDAGCSFGRFLGKNNSCTQGSQ